MHRFAATQQYVSNRGLPISMPTVVGPGVWVLRLACSLPLVLLMDAVRG
jgi:hypothetical protein